MRSLWLVLFIVVAASGCSRQPGSALSASDASSLEEFKRTAVPVLESRCSINCHGVDQSSYEAFMKEPGNAQAFYFPVNGKEGKIPTTRDALLAAYQAARSGGPSSQKSPAQKGRIEYGESPEFSRLLRVPLAESFGGLPHRGMDIFVGTTDPAYRALRRWVTCEIDSHPITVEEAPAASTYFRDHVQTVLERKGCFLSSCHGPEAFNDFKLVPPLPRSAERPETAQRFSQSMSEHNHVQALGEVTRFVNLGGDPLASRLLAKTLPLDQGGVPHRGGNHQFFQGLSDPDLKILTNWISLERESLASKLHAGSKNIEKSDLGRLQGVAFIRGPRHNPRRFFHTEPFWPGSDLYVLPISREGKPMPPARNLSSSFHQTPVEIQALDLRYDGRAIVFSMRKSIEEPFRLFQLEINDDLNYVDGSLKQLSFGPERLADGALIHHLDPIYIPGPDQNDLCDVAVAYSSNAGGTYCASQPAAIVGEAEGGKLNVLYDAQRTEAPGTFKGRRISIVGGPDRGSWRKIIEHLPLTDGVGSRLVLDRPLHHRPDRHTVYVIEGDGSDYQPGYDIWRLVPGRGQAARRMTFSSAQERCPTMRTSGEVMFTSVRDQGYQADLPVFNGAIFRVQAGGFDYHIHGGNRSRYPLYTQARELPSGQEIRLALDPKNLWSGGLLLLADHGLGINIEPDNPLDNLPYGDQVAGLDPAIQRFIPSQRTVFPETGPGSQAVTATGLSPGGSFRDPFPLPDGRILLARTTAPIDHLNPHSDPDWNLWVLDPSRSLLPLEGGNSPRWAETYPRPVMVRLKEKSHTHQKFASPDAESKPVEEDGVLRMPAGTPGVVECFDYPLLQSFLTYFAPVGSRDFRLDGNADLTLAFVRILANEPVEAADVKPIKGGKGDPCATSVSLGMHGRKRIVAELPLEADGSFYAQVPPEVPLLIQGLNRERMALQSMTRWFYVQPGEKLSFSIPRSIFPLRCAGCHGALTGDRKDALGPPDLVSASSRVMANWDPLVNKRRSPVSEGKDLNVDFRTHVQPILDQHCISCHGQNGDAGLDLRGIPTANYSVSYEALHRLEEPASHNPARKRFINERGAMALESFLLEKLLGRKLKSSQALKTVGIAHPAEHPLSPEEVLVLTRWIDLGATFQGPRAKP